MRSCRRLARLTESVNSKAAKLSALNEVIQDERAYLAELRRSAKLIERNIQRSLVAIKELQQEHKWEKQ